MSVQRVKNSNIKPELIAFTPTNEICQQFYCQNLWERENSQKHGHKQLSVSSQSL